MSNKLKSCPFCGAKAKIRKEVYTKGELYVVKCTSCSCCLEWFDTEKEAIEAWNRRAERMSDNIHPDHYKLSNGVEVIDFIEALGLGAGFEIGNAIKYISRLGKKNGEDVKTTIDKAIWYLSRFKDKYVNNSQKMTFFDKNH